jgi:hypothetical protein
MSSCGKSLTSTSSMRILDQGSTIPAPVDYEGILKMEGASGLQSTDSTQASTFKFWFRPDNVDVQIIDPLVGAASCQDLRGEGSASSQGDRRCGSRCGRRPPRPLRPPRTGGERKPDDSKHDDCAWTWVPSVKTVAGADSRISAGPAGRVQLEKNLWVQEYTGISGYIVPQTWHIEW